MSLVTALAFDALSRTSAENIGVRKAIQHLRTLSMCAKSVEQRRLLKADKDDSIDAKPLSAKRFSYTRVDIHASSKDHSSPGDCCAYDTSSRNGGVYF